MNNDTEIDSSTLCECHPLMELLIEIESELSDRYYVGMAIVVEKQSEYIN